MYTLSKKIHVSLVSEQQIKKIKCILPRIFTNDDVEEIRMRGYSACIMCKASV